MPNAAPQMYNTILSLQNIDDASLIKAKELFQEYRKKGIIKNDSFEENCWDCTDEYSNIGIHFNFNKFSYNCFYKPIFGIALQDFISCVKIFVMFSMGDIVLNTIRDVIYDINKLIKNNPEELYAFSDSIFLHHPNRIITFFSMLPEPADAEQMDNLLNALDAMEEYRYSLNQSKHKRMLASFDSYFLFNDILNDYWKSEIDIEERLFFYPLYLWWKITGVIPLRPREFILTPRNCLNLKEDGWYITLRRNHLKGSEKKVSYKIEQDYFKVEYKIPDKLAVEIQEYINLTQKYESTELETLFVTDTHYKQWNHKKHSNSRYFTYINMNCVMRYFYRDVIEKRYKLNIIYDREVKYLEDGFINYLYLGDTRHLALINIIAEGGTPVLAMLLAGHENIEMSAHYYSNITSLIECRTYRQYRNVLKGNVSYEISRNHHLPLNIRDFVFIENRGRCYSPAFAANNFSDCQKVCGPTGEIGYCPYCTYYRQDKEKKFFKNDDYYKQKIKFDCDHLERVVKNVRLLNGNQEDILQAMLRLQTSSYNYQQYKEEKMFSKNKEI